MFFFFSWKAKACSIYKYPQYNKNQQHPHKICFKNGSFLWSKIGVQFLRSHLGRSAPWRPFFRLVNAGVNLTFSGTFTQKWFTKSHLITFPKKYKKKWKYTNCSPILILFSILRVNYKHMGNHWSTVSHLVNDTILIRMRSQRHWRCLSQTCVAWSWTKKKVDSQLDQQKG